MLKCCPRPVTDEWPDPDAAVQTPDGTPAPPGRYAALLRLHQRHGATPEARARQAGGVLVLPHEGIRLVELLGAGSAEYLSGESPVDVDDLLAALMLMDWARAELDETELGLLELARGRGATWGSIGAALGLGSAQAAQQRRDRLARRRADAGAEDGLR
jgi:hypothetical protein